MNKDGIILNFRKMCVLKPPLVSAVQNERQPRNTATIHSNSVESDIYNSNFFR